jgi:hypothetical protein
LCAQGAERADVATSATQTLYYGYYAGYDEEKARFWQGFAEFIEQSPEAQKLLETTLVDRVIGLKAASSGDLKNMMQAGEVQLAHCGLSVFYPEPPPEWKVLGQLRHPLDHWDPRGQLGVSRQSVFIMRKAGATKSNSESLADVSSWAFLGSDSASGYLYPRIYLMQRDLATESADITFCATPAEVLFRVYTGLSEAGALDRREFATAEEEFQRMIAAHDGQYEGGRLQRVEIAEVQQTPPFPADPLLFATDPNHPGRRHLWVSLLRLYNKGARTDYRFQSVTSDPFTTVRDDLKYFYREKASQP